MRINHVIKTNQWRAAPPRSAFYRIPLLLSKLYILHCYRGLDR